MQQFKLVGKCAINGIELFNDIHPLNMSWVIANALANNGHGGIKYMAFGNMGTWSTDCAIMCNKSNDGIEPDYSWSDSTLYNEIYHTDIACTSTEENNYSTVNIINALDSSAPTENGIFLFDELGLKTQFVTTEEQYIQFNDTLDIENTGLLPNTLYSLNYFGINGHEVVDIKTPLYGTGTDYAISYFDLIDLLYYSLVPVSKDIDIKLDTQNKRIKIKSTIKLLQFNLSNADSTWLFHNINEFKYIHKADNVPFEYKQRLLTHLTFAPVEKPDNAQYLIKYTISIFVDRTKQKAILDRVAPGEEFLLPSTYEHCTLIPLTIWVINHNLGYTPSFEVYIDDIRFYDCKAKYIDEDTMHIIFKVPKRGIARLN